MEIRPVRQEDLARVKHICRMTAGPGARSDEKIGEIIANTYSVYYVREEPDYCFVLEDKGEAQGYVLCAPDYNRFKRIYREKDVPVIKALSKRDGKYARILPYGYFPFRKKYPAHLHIDILEGYRGGGNGTRMIETLLEKLKAEGVPGVMLIVDAHNTDAVRFYERNGFKKLFSALGGICMGQKLDS